MTLTRPLLCESLPLSPSTSVLESSERKSAALCSCRKSSRPATANVSARDVQTSVRVMCELQIKNVIYTELNRTELATTSYMYGSLYVRIEGTAGSHLVRFGTLTLF